MIKEELENIYGKVLTTSEAVQEYEFITHRRVRFEDLIVYKKRIDIQRVIVLKKLAEQAQELDLGY